MKRAGCEEDTGSRAPAGTADLSEPAVSVPPPAAAKPGVILAVACLAQFMVVLDVSVVNVALPAIRASLHYSPSGLQWVVNAYVLTFAGFLMLGGRASDLFGRRRVFAFGLLLFVGASLVGGFAQNSAWLTAARAVQGLGGAVLSPASLTIIMTTFPEGRARLKALGTWSAVAGSGGAFGVVIGGVLTTALSWRWVLFINVPIGLIGLVVGVRYLTEIRSGRRERLDIAGAVTVTAGLAAVVYAIVGTDTHAWGSAQTVGTLAIGVGLLGAFLVIQVRSASPLVPLRLFRSRSVTGANLTMFGLGAAFFSFWYFLSLYVEEVLGFDALHTGIAFFPIGAFIALGAQLSSRLVPRVGSRPLLVVGLAMAAAGAFWLTGIGVHSEYWAAVFGPGSMVALGFGLSFTPLAAAATSGVARQEAGLASGLLNTSRQVGGSVGQAVLATLASSRSTVARHAGSTAAAAATTGYARAFLVAGFFLVAALLATTVLPGRLAAVRRPVGKHAVSERPALS
jgi:EmrB/QacA subfamily drug resistance transporter